MFRNLAIASTLSMMVLPRIATAQGATNRKLLVPMVNTPISRSDLASALIRGHIKEFGTLPSINRLSMGLAQVGLENGNGKYSYNHNLGNIGPGSADKPWYISRLDGGFYEAFPTFEAAAARYWHVVAHCQGVLPRFDWGGVAEAASMLRQCGYFGADLKTYTAGWNDLYYTGLKISEAAIVRYWLDAN